MSLKLDGFFTNIDYELWGLYKFAKKLGHFGGIEIGGGSCGGLKVK